MIKILDVPKFIKTINGKEVIEDKLFTRDGDPMPGSLTDPAIFGVTGDEKLQRWGYIDLREIIMHPLIYNSLHTVNAIFKNVLNRTKHVKIVDGVIVEDEKGKTGIEFFIDNWSKIDFEKYRTPKNMIFVDFLIDLTKHAKNKIFINKIPVIPIGYRESRMTSFKVEMSEIDEMYNSIIRLTKENKSDFTTEFMKNIKDKTNRDIIEGHVLALFNYFIKKLEGKKGFLIGTLLAKRLDNVARLTANARPDIPIDSVGLPWHIILNLFDTFFVAMLEDIENQSPTVKEIREGLGITNRTITEYGQLFDYIYRNSETYDKHHPGHKKLWIQLIIEFLNDNPDVLVLVKRDPGWDSQSFWTFKPLIIEQNSYQIWVPSFVYSPYGGDSFSAGFFLQDRDPIQTTTPDETNTSNDNGLSILYEDNDFIYKKPGKVKIVRSMRSFWDSLKPDDTKPVVPTKQ